MWPALPHTEHKRDQWLRVARRTERHRRAGSLALSRLRPVEPACRSAHGRVPGPILDLTLSTGRVWRSLVGRPSRPGWPVGTFGRVFGPRTGSVRATVTGGEAPSGPPH